MYYPPLFTSVPRSFDPRASNPLGGSVVDVPLVGPTPTRENNPLDLTVKTLPSNRHSPPNVSSSSVVDHSNGDPADLMMLDHRKLANLAASHSLSSMGRQLGPAVSAATLLDPTLYRLTYGPEAMVPPPFCYDRATGVAAPNSLAGHQLMASFLQQQQRDRCLEQQQALFAARTTVAQQAAVAAAAAAFMDPNTLPYNLRTAMSQRETAAALAATRALYAPTMPTPMVLPAFSLYTDDKGAFTSLRNGTTTDKAYINGTTALEAARFAEHLQRIREQHLQQAAKCSNSCCSTLSGLGPTVPCACCIQSPSQAALCARSPMGCGVKDPTTAATASKVCNTACDFLQPGLTFLHRPAVVTSSSNSNTADLRLPTVTASTTFCATTTTTTPLVSGDIVSSATSSHVFQPATTWSSGLPQVSNSNKTAFSVPKKKEISKEVNNTFINKDTKISKDFDGERIYYHHHHHQRDTNKIVTNIKKEREWKDESSDVIFIKEDVVPVIHHRREHDVKSLLTPRTVSTSVVVPKPPAISNHGVAHTTLTTVTPTVPTKCEGGTIMAKTTKLPPVLEPFRPVEPQHPVSSGDRYPLNEVSSHSAPSPQGPPPLIAAANGHHQLTSVSGKDSHSYTADALRHQSLLLSGIPSSPYKNFEKTFVGANGNHEKTFVGANSHHEKTFVGANSHHEKTFVGANSHHEKTFVGGANSHHEKTFVGANSHHKSPKKAPTLLKSNGLPSYIKEEPSSIPAPAHHHPPPALPPAPAPKTQSSSVTLPKPIPHLPPAPATHLPPAHYASHYRPYNHLQNTASWLPPAHPNVTIAPPPPKSMPTSSPSTASTVSTTKVIEPVIKQEPETLSSAAAPLPPPNVLQSLLVRPGAGLGLPPPLPGAYPLLDYQYHHQHHLGHSQNLAQGGVGPAVVESVSPAVASTAPPLEKVEVKVESGGGGLENNVASTGAKYSKKRHSTTPTKSDYGSATVPEKKRFLGNEFASVPGYAFQYPSFTPEVKETPVCPYTFVEEPPGYYESQALVPSELRPQKLSATTAIHPLENKPIDDNGAKFHEQVMPEKCQDESGKLFSSPMLSSMADFHIRNAKRAATARARSKLRKRVLSRIFRKPRHLLSLVDSSPPQKQAAGTATATSPVHHSAIIGPVSDIPVVPTSASVATAPPWRHGKFLFKIAKRRRIRSGLDMALKRNKKKTRRVLYKIEPDAIMKQCTEDSNYKLLDASGIPIPAEMKRLMVNKALGETILHRAARLGYPEVVAYCLETNCGNVNTRDNAGYTPLHECCSRGHLDIARALLQYGADVNASAAGGIRPLHDAVENDHVEVVRLLLSFGADPSIATYSGLTPLKLARSPLMAEFLQGFMADISGEIDYRPHLPWRFWGSAYCLDPEDNGYDVFDGVPSDNEAEVEGEGDDFLFEVSDSPHLPTFRLPLPTFNSKAQYNFLRLSDVLRKISMSREKFLELFSHIEVLTVPRHEFEASATCSQLLTGSKLDSLFTSIAGHRIDYDLHENSGHTVDLVRLDNPIRKVLGIETISVR